MNTVDISETVREAVRVLFLAMVPITVAGIIGGMIAALFDVFFAVRDSALSYATRLLACMLAVGALFASVSQSVMELLLRALQ